MTFLLVQKQITDGISAEKLATVAVIVFFRALVMLCILVYTYACGLLYADAVTGISLESRSNLIHQ